MKKDIIYILIIIILILIFFNRYNYNKNISNETIKIDTTYITDTIYLDKLKVDTMYLTKYIVDTLKIKGEDTLKEVEIPISTTIYKDSTYEAKISGYKAKLDYLKVYPRETIITKERLVKTPKKRFNWGIQSGVGYGTINEKVDVYIGLGFQYNF